MNTIILEYDARNSLAKKAMDVILALGVFTEKKQVEVQHRKGLDEAMKDVACKCTFSII
jgi:hypothetical protein